MARHKSQPYRVVMSMGMPERPSGRVHSGEQCTALAQAGPGFPPAGRIQRFRHSGGTHG
ncbi:MAG: hypothetical protein HPY69_13195 [Armatimonadetes bacterium]|nr:hypothetical protein [Armatimonadota bacterium]